MSFFEKLQELGELIRDSRDQWNNDVMDMATNGFVEMVIKGNPDYKTPFEKRQEKMETGVAYGDIIGIHCHFADIAPYDHYGVYVSDASVIHYAGEDDDRWQNIHVRDTSLSRFVGEAEDYFILVFPDVYDMPRQVGDCNLTGVGMPLYPILDVPDFIKRRSYHLYSPDETVERARSRMGEDQYDLLCNNCEHFAIWCKTGIAESHQVKRVLGIVRMMAG